MVKYLKCGFYIWDLPRFSGHSEFLWSKRLWFQIQIWFLSFKLLPWCETHSQFAVFELIRAEFFYKTCCWSNILGDFFYADWSVTDLFCFILKNGSSYKSYRIAKYVAYVMKYMRLWIFFALCLTKWGKETFSHDLWYSCTCSHSSDCTRWLSWRECSSLWSLLLRRSANEGSQTVWPLWQTRRLKTRFYNCYCITSGRTQDYAPGHHSNTEYTLRLQGSTGDMTEANYRMSPGGLLLCSQEPALCHCFFNISFKLSSHLRLGLQSCLIPSVFFPIK